MSYTSLDLDAAPRYDRAPRTLRALVALEGVEVHSLTRDVGDHRSASCTAVEGTWEGLRVSVERTLWDLCVRHGDVLVRCDRQDHLRQLPALLAAATGHAL